jgi:hypothetical protein
VQTMLQFHRHKLSLECLPPSYSSKKVVVGMLYAHLYGYCCSVCTADSKGMYVYVALFLTSYCKYSHANAYS